MKYLKTCKLVTLISSVKFLTICLHGLAYVAVLTLTSHSKYTAQFGTTMFLAHLHYKQHLNHKTYHSQNQINILPIIQQIHMLHKVNGYDPPASCSRPQTPVSLSLPPFPLTCTQIVCQIGDISFFFSPLTHVCVYIQAYHLCV